MENISESFWGKSLAQHCLENEQKVNMKYKLKRDLPWAKAGTIVDADFTRSGNGNISYSFVAQKGEYEEKEIWQGWYPKQYGDWSDWFEEVDERWKPKFGEDVFYVGPGIEVLERCYTEEPWQQLAIENHNIFPTKELAEQAAEQIKALLKEFHKNNPQRMAKKKKVTHRIPYGVWANSQLSIVHRYGACILNDKKYVLDKEMQPVIKDGEERWFPDLVTYE